MALARLFLPATLLLVSCMADPPSHPEFTAPAASAAADSSAQTTDSGSIAPTGGVVSSACGITPIAPPPSGPDPDCDQEPAVVPSTCPVSEVTTPFAGDACTATTTYYSGGAPEDWYTTTSFRPDRQPLEERVRVSVTTGVPMFISTHAYSGDDRLLGTTTDLDGDGSIDACRTVTYFGSSVTVDDDSGPDGLPDHREVRTYDSDGRLLLLTKERCPNGTATIYEEHTWEADGRQFSQLTYDYYLNTYACAANSYDANGRLLRTDYDALADGTIDSWEEYAYSADGATINSQYFGSSGAVTSTKVLTFDDAGHLVSQVEDALADGSIDLTVTWQYDAEGRLVQTSRNGALTIYEYDSNDNVSRTTTYDEYGLLTSEQTFDNRCM